MSSEAPPPTDQANQHLLDLDSSAPATTSGTTRSSLENAKNTVFSSELPTLQFNHDPTLFTSRPAAQSAMDTITNHPITQNVKDTVQNGENDAEELHNLTPEKDSEMTYASLIGPLGQKVKEHGAKTSSEFQDLSDARRTPDEPAATGQPLTHYHSMFYRLLSWKNPRATAITFVVSILFIFAARYLNILRYMLKGSYMALGITAAAEVVGHAALGGGLTSRVRPRKYYVIPKDSLQRFSDDFCELLNFFVIEFQRILFAENIWVTIGAFFASFLGYWLVKWVPLWGLALVADSIIFLAPLVYVQNKELIDQHVTNAGNIINDQANQMRDLAAQHTGRATETMKQYTSEYTKKAQEMMGQTGVSRQKAGLKTADFPSAPKDEPVSTSSAAKADPEPVPAS